MVIDSGASLTRPGPTGASESPGQRQAKARTMAAGYARGGIDAMALSSSDWALGPDFVRGLVEEFDLPVLAANLECEGAAPWPASKVVDAGGHRIGIIAVTEGRIPGCELSSPGKAIQAAARELDVDFAVALVPSTDIKNAARLAAAVDGDLGVDLVVDAANRSLAASPHERAGAWWISPGGRGKHIGIASLTFTEGASSWTVARNAGNVDRIQLERVQARLAEAEKAMAEATDPSAKAQYEKQIEAYQRRATNLEAKLGAGDVSGTNQVVIEQRALDRSIEDHPATAKIVADGKDAIAATVKASPTKFVARVVPAGPYAGGETCAGCHQGPHAQWSTTGHARAWQALVVENRALDDECWSCHVTGAHQKGGPSRVAESGPFRDVQCEACHGPSRQHLANPEDASVRPVRDPGVELCQTCHDGKQDGGRFDDATYRPKVVHTSNDTP